MKTCTKCGLEQPLTLFWKKKGSPDGHDTRCKQCRNGIRNSDPETKERKRRAALKHKYGITVEQYDSMLESQGGVCASCGLGEVRKETENLAVDHDHKTGQVRALLCQKCNTALGLLDDDPLKISALLEYIKQF